jgi:hypothetical protein
VPGFLLLLIGLKLLKEQIWSPADLIADAVTVGEFNEPRHKR